MSEVKEHYHENYYQARYTKVLSDDVYRNILAEFWKKTIFTDNHLNEELLTLDYGSGLGQVSAALPHVEYFDVSAYAVQFLKDKGKKAYQAVEDIPTQRYDYLLSSHVLEHSPTPFQDLMRMRNFMKPEGQLILILPIEVNLKPSYKIDRNRHYYAWTFQNITNLLLESGWKPEIQRHIYGPFLLRTIARIMPVQAVGIAGLLGRLKGNYKSMMTISKLA